MKITNVQIRPLINPHPCFNKSGSFIKAYASVTFDNVFIVHSVKIIENQYGTLNIGMYDRKTRSGIFKDVFHPIDAEFRKELREKIISAFLESN
jgi:stage V sporulation protein G